VGGGGESPPSSHYPDRGGVIEQNRR